MKIMNFYIFLYLYSNKYVKNGSYCIIKEGRKFIDMSEQTGKNGTFFTLTKWFKWFGVILILVPVTWIIVNGLYLCPQLGGPTIIDQAAYDKVGFILEIITIVAAALWVILDVILIFAAGTVRAHMSPLNVRVWLFIALVLVFAWAIFDILVWFDVFSHVGIDYTTPVMRIVRTFLPLASILGLAISTAMATKIKRKLM